MFKLSILLFSLISLNSYGKINPKKELSAFGRVSIMTHYEDSDLSLEDSGSRIGLYAQKKLTKKFRAYAKGEWAFNSVNNTADLSIGNDNKYTSTDAAQTFRRRLGFVAFDLDTYGELRFGKQWSVYSDVSHYTDDFNLFGGSASGTYNLRTDGGQSGTGRVSHGVTYRNQFWGIKYGLQAKLIKNKELTLDSNSSGVTAKDSYGMMIQRAFGKFHMGIAYNQIDLEGDENAISGYDGGNSWSSVLGLKYVGDFTTIAFVYNRSKNHEIDDGTTIFDGEGQELILSYKFTEKLNFKMGYNLLADFDNDLEDNEYQREYYIVGASLKPHRDIKLFIEGRSNQSKSLDGDKGNDSAGVGAVLYF